jgi:hypothetical protein
LNVMSVIIAMMIKNKEVLTVLIPSSPKQLLPFC